MWQVPLAIQQNAAFFFTIILVAFCNRYPSIDVTYQIVDADNIYSGGSVVIHVQLDRDDEEDIADLDAPLEPVIAPFYPMVLGLLVVVSTMFLIGLFYYRERMKVGGVSLAKKRRIYCCLLNGYRYTVTGN
jgi:hypothetical protein